MHKSKDGQSHRESRKVNSWVYIAALLVNVVLFACIGTVYLLSSRSYRDKLQEENIRNVGSLNAASANAAYTYTDSMGVKINDLVSYIESNGLDHGQVVRYLRDANTNPDRQFQLILSGSYGQTGQLSFGDYSGLSFRKQQEDDGTLLTLTNEVRYGSGYYEVFSAFSDVNDEGTDGLCFVQEFTDPDTKAKCFAAYRHVILDNAAGRKALYTILLVVNSQTALNSYNMQSEYQEQSTVLVDGDGNYIIKNSEYRNANFYDYIVNYNGLTLDWKEKLLAEVRDGAAADKSVNLFYKNHRGEECVFAVNAMKTGWYSITCVPLSAFDTVSGTVNYSLIILLLFLALFLIDGVAILFVGKVMRYNINVAEQATKDAVSANQAKSRFLSTMSHELRTPLNAVIGLVSLSEDSIDDPSVLRNYLKKIDISSKLLLQLISDILDVSAIESNKLKLNTGEFDIARLISALSAIFYDQCAAKGIVFEVSLKNMTQTMLIGDSVRVNQVLLNFLSNAVKFTPGGGKVTLRAEQVSRDDGKVTVRFEVEDTGCGISQEMRSRLFKPFERATGDSARRYSGSGLGLSIAKNLIELMHGTLGVDSKEGEGSRFWAEIPLGVPVSDHRRGFSPIGNMRVLAVVTNADQQEYIGQMLQGFGVEYLSADDLDAALMLMSAKAEAQTPVDLCILDWRAPDLDAPIAAARVRAVLGSRSPRIMVLAYDIADASVRCTEAGADFVFGKPVFPSALYNTLAEIAHNSVSPLPISTKNVDFAGKRILLVEDNKLNTEIAVLLLKKAGLLVETAENGKLGVDVFNASVPGYFDCILMDVQMPVMNGYEATAAIRVSAHPQAKTVPILAMTADAFAEDMVKARAAGMNEHISKPVVPEDLYALLKRFIHDDPTVC